MAGPSGATARLALPYPIPSDTADVPRDVQALATKLDTSPGVGLPIVTSLPASPADGQQVIWKPSASSLASAIQPYWHMVHEGGWWWYLGGSPAETNTFPGWTWTAPLTTVVPYSGGAALTIPVAGNWAFEHPVIASRTGNANAVQTTMAWGIVDEALAFLVNQAYTYPPTGNSAAELATRGFASMTAGKTLRVAGQVTLGANTIVINNAGTAAQIRLRCWPLAIPAT